MLFLSVSDKHKAIYIHIPKVAGTYIHTILIKYYDFVHLKNDKTVEEHLEFIENTNLDELYDGRRKIYNMRIKGLMRYMQDILSDDKYKDYYKFTFVRNPYTRIISGWKYCLNNQSQYPAKYKDSVENHYDDYEFDEFLQNGPTNCSDFSYLHSFISQTDHLINSENKIDFQFIGKLENLKEDLLTVLKNLNITEFTHIDSKYGNTAKNYSMITKPNSFYLTPENISIINKLFEKDFINFNYPLK